VAIRPVDSAVLQSLLADPVTKEVLHFAVTLSPCGDNYNLTTAVPLMATNAICTKCSQVVNDYLINQTIRDVAKMVTPLLPNLKQHPTPRYENSSSSIPESAFGPLQWEQYCTSSVNCTPLPSNIDEILNSTCKIWTDKKLRESFMLYLRPSSMNNQAYCLSTLLTMHHQREIPDRCGEYNLLSAPAKAEWFLIGLRAFPGSVGKSFDQQQTLVDDYAQLTGIPYEIGRILDVMTATVLAKSEPSDYRLGFLGSIRCPEIASQSDTSVSRLIALGLNVAAMDDSPGAPGVAVVINLTKWRQEESKHS
jgi:hypothetical protein